MKHPIQSAGEAMPKTETAVSVFDLESPIEDARRMASILTGLIEECVGGNLCKVEGRTNTFIFTNTQRDNLMFAAYQTQDLLFRLRQKWETIA